MDDRIEASFTSLGLSTLALSAIERSGYTRPTPIQLQAIPPALAGRDVIGCAATGTGKTAAFLLPMLERLTGKKGLHGLILAPTRELAEQIAEQLKVLGHGRTLRGVTLIGGVGMGGQQQALRAPHEIIIATPGRLIDHMERGSVSLRTIDLLVLDEADRMLDMGFRPQLNRILAQVPKVRQTMLFSATMAGEVADFASQHLHKPVRVEVARSGATAARAEQRVFLCNQEEKIALLLTLLAEDNESTLVFTRTKHRADKVARIVGAAGHGVSRIHGNRSQGQRRSSLEGFRDGTHRVLIATDIAARGIDVEGVGHVILFDLPHVPEDYVHRIGRTARASASGRATTFCAPDEAVLLRAIEHFIRGSIPTAPVPRESAIFQSIPPSPARPQAVPSRAAGGAKQHTPPGRPGGGGRAGSGRTPHQSGSARNASSTPRGRSVRVSKG